jgi:hypothetical protein
MFSPVLLSISSPNETILAGTERQISNYLKVLNKELVNFVYNEKSNYFLR